MSSKFTLQNFAEQCQPGKFYRLDIIRGVSFEDCHDPSMPFRTLIVNFSIYEDKYQSLDKIKAIPAKDIFKSYLVKSGVHTIKVDVTNQILLRPGTVWKNGSPVWEPSEFFNVTINQSEKSVVTLSAMKNTGINMPFIENGLNLQFLKFPESTVNGNTIDILIPTTEVIRHYFSGSTYLTQQVFNGALREFRDKSIANKLFYDFKVDENLKSVYIWLKRNCYDSDAILIARALADPQAMNAMSYIYSSLFYAIKNFKDKDKAAIVEACPRTYLPFTGGTDLEVLGQWLPPKKGEDEFTTFIVRTIEKCDHPLPFKKLEIESVDSYSSSGTESKDKKPRPAKQKNKERPEHVGLEQGEKPTNKLESEELNFYSQRFSHLQDIEIEKIKKVSDKEKERRFEAENDLEETDKGSTLSGDYSKNNNLQPWQNKINDAEAIPLSDRLKKVSEALDLIIKRRGDLSAQAIPIGFTDDSYPFGFYSFIKPEAKPGNYLWDVIEINGSSRQRQALFLELEVKNKGTAYLLEIEGKGTVGFSLYLMANPSEGFDVRENARALMYDIANKSGAKVVTETLKEFSNVVSLKHVEAGEDSFADRIERAVDGAFNS